MTRNRRTTAGAALLALAAALVLAARLLTAGAAQPAHDPSATSARGPQSTPGDITPLPDFKPSEELPADAAVAFPTDI
jgi:hypothetical protein